MKIALFVNPHSGGQTCGRKADRVQQLLRARRIDVDPHVTRSPAELDAAVQACEIEAYDVVACMGGDGANYRLINALLKYHDNRELPPIGLIPAGRGNSFARDLDIFSLEEGVDAILRQRPRAVDVCQFTQGRETFHFINLMGFGFVTDAAATAFRCRWAGDASYVIGVLFRVAGLASHHLDMEIDGRLFTGKNCFVEICNSRFTGGSMEMAPHARIDDGFFDAVIVRPLSRIALVATFPRIFKGTHLHHPAVEAVRGKTARIATRPRKALLPDGELFGHTPTRIDIVPGRLRYLV